MSVLGILLWSKSFFLCANFFCAMMQRGERVHWNDDGDDDSEENVRRFREEREDQRRRFEEVRDSFHWTFSDGRRELKKKALKFVEREESTDRLDFARFPRLERTEIVRVRPNFDMEPVADGLARLQRRISAQNYAMKRERKRWVQTHRTHSSFLPEFNPD